MGRGSPSPRGESARGRHHCGGRVKEPVNLYDSHYAKVEAEVYRAVRAETYGEDLGQASWITTAECDEFCRWIGLEAGRKCLEIACGSGGVSVRMAQRLGLSYSPDKLTEPDFNLQVGTTYFRQVMGMFDGNLELALAGYNGGPYRIKRLWNENRGGDLDRFLEGLGIEESKTYVKRILLLSDSYRQLYPGFGQTAS